MSQQITIGAAAIIASLSAAALTLRWYLTPGGRHRASRPAPGVDPFQVTAYLPCTSRVCCDSVTTHVEVGEDRLRCTRCGAVTA